MKSLMTLCLIALTGMVTAQLKINITIIGTAHYFDDEYQSKQSFDDVQDFIVDLNPDIICIESIPIEDSLSLKEIWPNTMKRADRLRDTLQYDEAWIGANEEIIKGAHFYASYDFWNGYYHWFSSIKNGDSLGYFQSLHKNLKNSEYGLMVFPAAKKLGIEKFYGIDYRDGEKDFLEANSKVLKKLFFGVKWKPLGTYLKTQKKYKRAEREGQLIEFINGDEFQNAFSQLIDDLPKRLPKSKEAKFIQTYWLNRNLIMADRIIKVARDQKANDVLLTVGSAHVTHLQQYLEAAGHHVTTYGQILNTQNQ
ncbi:MAG: DUF5694 domain-containing protein [Bacteroidota bacterium]